ncbi:MAG: helix-turn-helix transcriptional regulator [Desulfomicrobium sp.]
MERFVSHSEQNGKTCFGFEPSQDVSPAIPDSMEMYQEALAWLKARCEAEGQGNIQTRVGAAKATFSKALKGDQDPSATKFMGWIETLGAKLIFPGDRQDMTRDVIFANPRMVNVPEGSPPPEAHNYLAVPMVGWSGAGTGVDDPIEPDGNYLMVIRKHPSVRTRTNLIGVKIAKGETSMKGLMNPGDIVVVDRDDIPKNPKPPGNIYLVRDPDSPGGVMIKRVIFQESKKGNLDIVFYSENAAEHPPKVFDFHDTFEDNAAAAIVGRVVVCFSDMTDK